MKWETKRKFSGMMFVFPWVIGFIVFTLFPVIQTVRYSLSNVTIGIDNVGYEWIGAANYRSVLLEDPEFLSLIPEYIRQIVLFVPMTLIFSILISLLLNQRMKGRSLFRAIYFLPVILMSGPLLTNLIELDATTLSGVKNFFLYKFIDQTFSGILQSSLLFIFDNMALILWFCGVQMLIFLSYLQKTDSSIYEAARVDGADKWQQFWKITMPMLKPFIFINAVYTISDISASSLNKISKMINKSMFTANRGFGFGAAVSYIYFLVVILLIVVVFLIFGRGDNSEKKRIKRDEKESEKLKGFKGGRAPVLSK